MKKIPEPKLKSASVLSPAEMNAIHFGGNHTPLTPSQIAGLAAACIKAEPKENGQTPAK